ncbi:MAG: S41 family peptidase [Bacteroidales bacterium]
MNIFGKLMFGCIITTSVIAISLKANGQSANFKAGQNLEIQYNILKELKGNYVDTINMEKLINTGIAAMLESLDPYTEFLPEEDDETFELMRTATYGGIGAVIKKIDSLGVVISQPYWGSPAVTYGLEPGDIILKIDGVDVKPLTADECSTKMKGQPGTQVTFLVKKARSGQTTEIKVTRDRVHIPDISYSGLLNDTTGYIKLDAFTEGGSKDVKKALVELKNKGMKKLVLDLRGNGGGIMEEAVNIVALFVKNGTEVVSAKGRAPEANFTYTTSTEPIDTLLPLMVLVNSGSASSSEIVAGALQDLDRATIMGTRTYGKGLVQAFRPTGYNGKLKLTTSKYYTPSGRCVQAIDYTNRNSDGSVGIVPDSLKKEFKTLKGRSVYDGGGIAPDIEIKSEQYSRPAVSLVVNDILGDFAIAFYAQNKTIAPARNFKLTDSQYTNFVKYAAARNFDSRSGAQTMIDQMLKAAKSENLYEINKAEFDALEKKLIITKEEMLKLKRAEFQPLLEEEIVQKYYFTEGRIQSILRNDKQLHKAIETWNVKK